MGAGEGSEAVEYGICETKAHVIEDPEKELVVQPTDEHIFDSVFDTITCLFFRDLPRGFDESFSMVKSKALRRMSIHKNQRLR